jgi:anhydro-N-acetylmuramic acid kinase
MQSYYVIGLMSGTSLDGLDIAYTEFCYRNEQWSFKLLHSKAIHYTNDWKSKLNNAMQLDALGIHLLDIELAEYFSSCINDFRKEFSIDKLDFISSHGHTVFHQPEKKLSLQIGAGQILATNCKVDVLCDFRKQDVAMGGQGAPLVPIGDKLLFTDYDFCLNIGGIANVSFEKNNQRIAYDICAANMVLNHYAEELKLNFDEDGKLAASGKLNTSLLNTLNELDFYKASAPKSLGKEWVYSTVIPIIDSFEISIENKLNTFCEHIAMQIGSEINNWLNKEQAKMLVTGGGTYHQYLIKRITHFCKAELVIPDKKIIEFKEAIIFAFLGVLKSRGENNCLASVTGAERDHCSGVRYGSN